jgi:hypothetical protein
MLTQGAPGSSRVGTYYRAVLPGDSGLYCVTPVGVKIDSLSRLKVTRATKTFT